MNYSKQDRYMFKPILAHILLAEGGYVNDPRDLGGATNKGIIQTTYDSYRLSKQLPKASVKNITDVEVADIYYSRYWLPTGCDQMPAKLAAVMFDIAVNMGVGKASGYLVEALGSGAKTWGAKLKNDLGYYLSKHPQEDLVKAILDRRRQSYQAYAKKPSQRVFLQGWLNRVNNLETFLKESDKWA